MIRDNRLLTNCAWTKGGILTGVELIGPGAGWASSSDDEDNSAAADVDVV